MSKFIERLNNLSPEKRLYTLQTLPTHLAEGGKTERFRTLLTNFEFIEAKILELDSQSLIADYDLTPSDDPVLHDLQRAFTQNGHLFDKCENLSDLAATLYSRLYAIPDLVPLISRLEATLTPPHLIPRHPLSDLFAPPRLLVGHTRAVLDCAISDGAIIVSCSDNGTLHGEGWQVGRINGWGDACPRVLLLPVIVFHQRVCAHLSSIKPSDLSGKLNNKYFDKS